MKKQILAIFSVVLIAISFAACGANDIKNDLKDDMSSVESMIDGTMKNPKISKNEAKDIALKHANLKEDEVTSLYSELETENNIRKYDVEFKKGNMEYDYEINAETGEIISFDHDTND